MGRRRTSFLSLVVAMLCVGCASADRSPASPPSEPASPRAAGSVLFVLSTADTQTLADGKTRATGYFLGEMYEAYRAVTDAGYTVVVATPDGRPAVIDPESLEPQYWKEHPQWREQAEALAAEDPALRTPLTLAQARERAEDFDGVVVPGGQGVMVDLLGDPDLHALLVEHGRTGRAVGLICHAPALLARLPSAGDPFAGRRVTSVSGAEELYIERVVMKGRARDRAIGRGLKQRGYRHRARFPGRSHAVRDGNLVTSQNPFSGEAFGRAYVEALGMERQYPGVGER